MSEFPENVPYTGNTSNEILIMVSMGINIEKLQWSGNIAEILTLEILSRKKQNTPLPTSI